MQLTFEQQKIINERLVTLSKSKFRSGFRLRKREIEYITQKGLEVIELHAFDFIKQRLAPNFISNDGKQTPMKGHPVFIALHATATRCRKCLFKWHKIPEGKDLNNEEILYIVEIIMEWLTINLLNKDR